MGRSYERERWDFVNLAVSKGMPEADAEGICRDANTVQRWAVRECNGEVEEGSVQADDGSWMPTGKWYGTNAATATGTVTRWRIRPSGPQAEARIRARVARMGTGWAVETQGDPRGSCVRLRIPGVAGNCGDGEWVAVPTRRY